MLMSEFGDVFHRARLVGFLSWLFCTFFFNWPISHASAKLMCLF